jgi:hypothetical protein
MSGRKYWPFALVLIILITSINFISLRKEKRSMDVTVNSKGIPEHGLFLIGPTESLFEKNLSAAQRERSSEFSQSAKLLSAVVRNGELLQCGTAAGNR